MHSPPPPFRLLPKFTTHSDWGRDRKLVGPEGRDTTEIKDFLLIWSRIWSGNLLRQLLLITMDVQSR
jgi:hypothetical protein